MRKTHQTNRSRGLLGSQLGAWALAVAALMGCRAPSLPRSTTQIDTRSRTADPSMSALGPHDLVAVTVFRQSDFSSPPQGARISADGTLPLPLVGSVAIGGLSVDEACRAIESALSVFVKEPSVTLTVLERSAKRFFLLGEIENNGPYPLDRPLTALEAVALGGGFESDARRSDVVILRRHEAELEVIRFDAETPGRDGFVQIVPDDVVFVPQTGTGRFSDDVLPILQGIGFTAGQMASVALIVDRL